MKRSDLEPGMRVDVAPAGGWRSRRILGRRRGTFVGLTTVGGTPRAAVKFDNSGEVHRVTLARLHPVTD